jgi:hypothetical protein
VTQTSTLLSTITTPSSSAIGTPSICSTNWISCPASFGGGCCQSGFTCAPDRSCTISGATSTASVTGIAPVRPTDTNTVTTAIPTSTPVASTCPTGFYACSAFYPGAGCCRIGRDCQTTSCPAVSSTTIISNGLTVVVPVGSAAAVATPTGACASGWSTCAASLGGNCCPSGYACGTASCSSLSSTQTNVVQKGSPSSGSRNIDMWSRWSTLACSLVGFILL